MSDNKYMDVAIKEAKKALRTNDIPVGVVIVKNNKIIAKAHNKKEKTKISTRHAEIIAIEKASRKLKDWHLDGCTIYTTLEPCLMCTGAIIQSRINNIVFAASNEKFGGLVGKYNILKQYMKKEKYIIRSGIREEESIKLLKQFFKLKR